MRFSRSNALGRFVVAALLLVLQLSPPALRHSHALSKDSDSGRRVTATGHAHCRGHSHGHANSHRHHHGSDAAAGHSHIAHATPHVHVQLLAFRLTLPLGNSSDGRDDRDFGNEAEFVIGGGFFPLLGDSMTAERDAWPPVSSHAAVSPNLICDVDHGRMRTGVISAAPPRPLCDSARHERSGVQLI